MLTLVLGITAVTFIGKLAVQSLGAARVTAILNRAFWILYLGWCALVLYDATSRRDWKFAATMLGAPLLLRGAVIYIARGRP